MNTDVLERLSELVRTRRAGLAALARSEGVTPEDAVDCVQEALVTFLQRDDAHSPERSEDDWGATLAVMVRNAARNRRRRHDRARPHDDLDAVGRTAANPRAPSAEEAIAWAEDHVRLRACVEELCEIQKAVVTLRMLEERPGDDVAAALGITPGHVAVLLHRAKSSLRACMTARA